MFNDECAITKQMKRTNEYKYILMVKNNGTKAKI